MKRLLYHLDGLIGAGFFLIEHLIKCEPLRGRYKPLPYIPSKSKFYVTCNACLKVFSW